MEFQSPAATTLQVSLEDEVNYALPRAKRRRGAGPVPPRASTLSRISIANEDPFQGPFDGDEHQDLQINGLELDAEANHASDSYEAESFQGNIYNTSFEDFLDDLSTQEWLSQQFPSLLPSRPAPEQRAVELNVPNPFAPGGAAEHPRLHSKVGTDEIPSNGSINGLVKFRMQPKGLKNALSPISRPLHSAPSSASVFSRDTSGRTLLQRTIPYLPPEFGSDLRLDHGDANLFKFYLVAYCAGRTLLSKSNGYLCDIAPMAPKNECVKHALLAMAASYVLDYAPSDSLRARANKHYKKAADLLSQSLKDPKTYTVGGEDSVLAALVLFSHDDLVNWELHHPRNSSPKWYQGARTAKLVLDKSDPGHRYHRPINVQSSHARQVLGNLIAMYDILSQVVCPLILDEIKNQYSWLLEGTEREVRRIVGLTGLSPKLLHIIGQISHLAARLNRDPDSTVVPVAGKIVEDRLRDFQQWSDLSEGHATAEDLMESCVMDENGKVSCAATVNELTAESYVAMAQIYLHCRLFRKSRRHPDVQARLRILLQCITRLPTSGFLYTAQGAVLRTLVAGIVAVNPEDRDVVRNQFVRTVKGPRGSIPPCWRALQDIWDWQDTELNDLNSDDCEMLASQTPWWETMATRLHQKEGRLNVC